MAATIAFAAAFAWRERSFHNPLLDLQLIASPLVSSGLAFKGAATFAVAGIGYLVALQLQLDWGWTPAQAALGMLPQVIVLVAGGAVISILVDKLGLDPAAWLSASPVVVGLAVYALLGRVGYVWIAVALVLVAAGMRVVGVVAGTNVMKGVPEDPALTVGRGPGRYSRRVRNRRGHRPERNLPRRHLHRAPHRIGLADRADRGRSDSRSPGAESL